MDDICAEAGLSKGVVYGYYKAKDDIMSALKVKTVQRDASIVRAATQSRDIARIGTAGIGGEPLADGLDHNTELEVRCITRSGERYDAPQRFGGGFSCSIGAWGTLT